MLNKPVAKDRINQAYLGGGYVPSWTTPRAAVQASVHGRRASSDCGSRAAHLASHVRRDVGALLASKVEAVHVELVRHIG